MKSAAREVESVDVLFARYGKNYRMLATLTAVLGTAATILNVTIINVAIPDVMGAFGIGRIKAQWLATGFMAAMTGTMLVNAWFVDSFGIRKSYTGALLVFTAASILGGLSPNINLLILSRVIQGAAAGLIQPLAMLTIFQVFPPEKRGDAMGIYGLGVVLAPAVGPTLGGLLIDTFSWRYVFFLAVPLCVLSALMSVMFLPEREKPGPRAAFDWTGLVLMGIFLSLLLMGLADGQRLGWYSNTIAAYFLVSVAAGAAFIYWEITSSNPMLDMNLFANRRFAAASVVSWVFGAGVFGSMFLQPLFAQTIQGYTPTLSGLLMMPGGLLLGIIFPVAGRLSDRMPSSRLIIGGLIFLIMSSVLMAGLDVNTPFWVFVFWIAISRIGMGIIFPPLASGALRVLPPEMISQGSGVINFMRNLGGSFGVNILTTVLERRVALFSGAFASSQVTGNPGMTALLEQVKNLLHQAGTPRNLLVPGAMVFLSRTIHAQANMMGFRESFLIVAMVFLLGLIPAWFMGTSRKT